MTRNKEQADLKEALRKKQDFKAYCVLVVFCIIMGLSPFIAHFIAGSK